MATKLSPPWDTYASAVRAFFELDPDIEVSKCYECKDDEGFDYAFNINCKTIEKFLALNRLMSHQAQFGNVSLKINIIDNTDNAENPYLDLFTTLFENNPRLKDIQSVSDPAGVVHNYIRFRPEVIQFYNDDLTDYNGNCTTLAEDIAYEIFGDNIDASVNFCTASPDEGIPAAPRKSYL